MTKLNPCGHCGSIAKLLGGGLSQEGFSISCNECNHYMEGCMDKNAVIDQWNKRRYRYLDGQSPEDMSHLQEKNTELAIEIVEAKYCIAQIHALAKESQTDIASEIFEIVK